MGKEKKKDNPGSLTLKERMIIVETDLKWLKKGYTVQILIGTGTFLTVLGLVYKIIGG